MKQNSGLNDLSEGGLWSAAGIPVPEAITGTGACREDPAAVRADRILTVKPPPVFEQAEMGMDLLPDKALTKNGEARTRYGRVVEEIVCGLLKLTDIPNSGSHDIVFDAFHRRSKTYCEVKSLRNKNKLPIYEWRREKDRICGVPLVYVIAIHRCLGVPTLAEVWRGMAETIDTILILPPTVIDECAERQDLKQLVEKEVGGRNGYRRAGYCEGYRNIPFSDLMDQPWAREKVLRAKVRGLRCKATVKFHPDVSWK